MAGGAAPGSSRAGSAKRNGRRRRPRLEGLESRQLLTTTLNDGFGLTGVAGPQGITAGPNGTVWFANTLSSQVQSLTANGTGGGTLGLAHTVGADPEGIIYVPGGNIWFTETGASAIGEIDPNQIDPATGTLGKYLGDFATPTANSGPQGITYDPATKLVYFTETLAGQIGSFNPATITSSAGISESNAVPTFGVTGSPLPNGITYDKADGKLWFVAQGTNQIGMFDPATNTFNTTAYNLPNASANPRPTSIALGSDGNLWFNDYATGQVNMFNPESKSFAEKGPWFPSSAAVSANPGAAITGVTAGPDGDIYFTAAGKGQVGWFKPSDLAATTNPDSAMGFANTPNVSSGPMEITAGPDGNVWFTENNGATGDGAIGVADLATQVSITSGPPSSVTVGDPFGLTVNVTYVGTGTPFNAPVTVSLASGPGGSLGGTTTVSAVNGVATFTNLTLSTAGSGYSLMVSGDGTTLATPNSITVTPTPTSPSPTPTSPSPTPTSPSPTSPTTTPTPTPRRRSSPSRSARSI